jgi:ribonucleoside-triphosphate reductase
MAKCNLECQIFSRVVGYLTPIDDWHIGKKSEFEDRIPFDGDKALKRIDDETDSDEAEDGS